MRPIRNFYAGPCALPLSVLRRIQDEMLDFRGTGMSVMEISHRAAPVVDLIEETTGGLKRLMGLGDEYEVLLLQGGSSLQFAMMPMNFSGPGEIVAYVDSGLWAKKAMEEARLLGRDVRVVASSAPDHRRIPADWETVSDARYLHLCTNNTIVGTQFSSAMIDALPRGGPVIMADMSSDLLSRRIDHGKFGLIYAHTQKSFGAAGVTIVALRRDLLDRIRDPMAAMLDYRTHVKARSNYNTPPVFAIYVVRLMLDWLEGEIGGIEAMERINRAKAARIYDLIDGSNFYHAPVEAGSRSMMNAVFYLPNPDLEKRFVAEAEQAGIVGLGGHRKWGGCRASLYNAVTLAEVEDLAGFMGEFVAANG